MTSRLLLVAALAGATALAACTEDYAVLSDAAPQKTNFTATLSGAQEVPAVTTNANGWANWVLEDANTIQYDIFVAGIDSITMAHFHANVAGQNGPIMAWFVPTETARAPGTGNISVPAAGGILRQNRVSRASLSMVAPYTWDSLVTRMRAGSTYLNIHTRRFPGGELRGQVGPGRRE
ncbi:MAG: CHRD domain-containing protein [Gemmatimonadaceae bacterium]|jgi:hypothetical protein|nr:CHRD domain-containing protein [Gemmatimonadaceae bacterium]